jgi:hypothetical protein
MVGGGAVAQADPDSSAVTPAWRRTISDVIVANIWAENATVAEIQAVKQGVYDQIQPLRELAPVPYGGQYINEVRAWISFSVHLLIIAYSSPMISRWTGKVLIGADTTRDSSLSRR